MRLFPTMTALVLIATAAGAQDHLPSQGPFAFSAVEETIAAAQNTGAPGYQASAPAPRSRGDGDKMITVTRGGEPVLAYRPSYYGNDGWQPNLTFSCGPNDTLDVTQMLFGYGEGEVPPPGATLELSIKPYGQDDFVMPVTLIDTLSDPRVLIRVHGRVPANEPFFRNLRATTNLQVQLIVNGKYQRLSGGGDLSSFDRDVKPLLDLCAGATADQGSAVIGSESGTSSGGGAPVGLTNPRPAIASVLTPNADEIKAALESRVAGHLAMYDGMADQCNTFQRDDNPLGAIACMMSGFGMASADNMGLTVHGVDLDECVRAESGLAFCRYRVNAEMHGQGIMGQVAQFANLGLALDTWSYGSFERTGRGWSMVRGFDHCSWGGSEINCTYTE